jgi:hypothetical protein
MHMQEPIVSVQLEIKFTRRDIHDLQFLGGLTLPVLPHPYRHQWVALDPVSRADELGVLV